VTLPILAAVVLGGLGFPVLLELVRDRLHPRRWTLHTRLTVVTSATLVVVGFVAVSLLEWGNPRTLGALSVPDRLLAGLFQGITPRSAGLTTVDFGQMHDTTWLVTDGLMFIGGGSGGTAGGIKVTTFAVLLLAIVAEVRGNDHAEAFGRAVPTTVLRQAISVLLIAVTGIALSTLVIMEVAPTVALDRALFETISAFATVGLSTGITPGLPTVAKLLLVVLMFVGRVGTISLASALALRTSRRLYRLPEERPIVG
jgi:Trk-type K+ transport system membrane component